MNGQWELVILDAMPPVTDMGSLVVGDVDGDGAVEAVVGGNGALLWYRLAGDRAFERGIIAEGRHFVVGLALEDLDGDGIMEVVVGETEPPALAYYKPGRDPSQPWSRYVLDPSPSGPAHDIIFADVDGDGARELLANAMGGRPGLFVYKRPGGPEAPWIKHAIVTGIFAEGLGAGDLDGDGRLEVVHGADWFKCPSAGSFSGPWERHVFAPSFREMCRVALVDVTGNGRPDVVIAESEFMDGRMSWFENRLVEDPDNPWVEHPVDRCLVFAHTLGASRNATSGRVRIFLAEMAEGGWSSPRNLDARLIEYATGDNGRTWEREVLYHGAGTHQAIMCDVDGDGVDEVVGKEWRRPKVQLFRRREAPSPLAGVKHRLLDRDKPATGIDILATDVNGNGRLDVVCASWWYENPGGGARRQWQRHRIPGVSQVINAFDIDGDGRDELIATKGEGLTSELCWLKGVDPANDEWEEHPIGTGTGDWPHGSVVAPILPGGRPALVLGYHSAEKQSHFPELFEIPDDPTSHPWPMRVLVEIPYGEEIVACDVDGDGKLDLVAGTHWLENLGDGTFRAHEVATDFHAARVRVADVNGDGRPDIVVGEEALDFNNKVTPLSRLAWLENPSNPRSDPWPMHVIDKVRCPHSLDVADLDGDGELEVICGEHDPFRPYRSRCRLIAYKKAEPQGGVWIPHVLDDRFEHHDGAKVFEVAPGRLGIISHGWRDTRYVHLWELH